MKSNGLQRKMPCGGGFEGLEYEVSVKVGSRLLYFRTVAAGLVG